MNNNTGLLNTLLHQAETAAQRHRQSSRLSRQAFDRQQERNDSETVAAQLDAVYRQRRSRLPSPWRLVQQRFLNSDTPW